MQLKYITIDANEPKGKVIAIKGKKTGSTTINFRDEDGYSLSNSSFTVKVSEVADTSKTALQLVKVTTDTAAAGYVAGKTKSDFSEDATLDYSDDKYAVYHLNEITSENIELGSVSNR